MLRTLQVLAVILLAALAVPLATSLPLTAQEAGAAQDAEAAPAAAAEEQAAAAEEEGPSYPAGLDDPGISEDELAVRVIPLTVDEAQALADAWLGIVQERTQAVVDTQVTINGLEEGTPEIDAAREELTELTKIRGEAFNKYSVVVDNFEAKGGDEAAVATYRAYRNAIIVDEKQQADWRTLVAQAIDWTLDEDGGIALAIQIGTVVASFIGLLFVARIFRGIARRWFRRIPNLSKLLQAFFAMVVYWLVLAIGLMVVLSGLGVDVTPLFALVGGASFIAAFAFQETLGNLAAGLMIMFNRPFDEGDYVSVAGTGGTVQSVSVVSTTVLTPDNQVIVIPNSKVWGDVITNVTASTTRRVDLTFGISYDDSIEQAQEILERLVADHPLTLEEPAPVIRVNELADSSVNFIVRPWARTEDYFAVYWDLTREVKEAFDAAGITIPYPQTDMHLRGPGFGGTGDGKVSAPQGKPAGAPDFRTGDEVETETASG